MFKKSRHENRRNRDFQETVRGLRAAERLMEYYETDRITLEHDGKVVTISREDVDNEIERITL